MDTENGPNSSSKAGTMLDDMIRQYAPDGNIDFDDDNTDAIYEAVAKFANTQDPLPETPEDIENFLESIPLFATHMPEEGKASVAFQAMQSIIDGVPQDKRMESMKDYGNKAYKLALALAKPKEAETAFEKDKRVKARKVKIYDALNHYHSALDLEKEVNVSALEDITEFKKLLSALHNNIAQCHILLENYGHSFASAKKAIITDNSSHKAYYRAAFSLYKLRKFSPAFMIVRKGLSLLKADDAKEQKTFLDLARDIITLWKREEDALRARREAAAAVKAEKDAKKAKLDALLAKRKITVGADQFRNQANQYPGELYVDEKNTLHFPLVLLYPDEGESDFLQDVDEYVTFKDVLRTVFPEGAPPAAWDRNGRYRADTVEVSIAVGESQHFAVDSVSVDDEKGEQIKFVPSTALGHALTAACKKGHVVPRIPTFCIRLKKK